VVLPVILIVRPKCCMAAVRSVPFTLLVSTGVSVLKLRCSRLWEDDAAGEDGDDEEEDKSWVRPQMGSANASSCTLRNGLLATVQLQTVPWRHLHLDGNSDADDGNVNVSGSGDGLGADGMGREMLDLEYS